MMPRIEEVTEEEVKGVYSLLKLLAWFIENGLEFRAG
jgi:hypothetical protein